MSTTEERAAEPAEQQESRMCKNTRTTAKATARKGSVKAAAKTSATKEARPGSKLESIGKMLSKKEGCTTADVLAATDWPSVSMPQQAKALGITLHKKKVDGVTRYADHAFAA